MDSVTSNDIATQLKDNAAFAALKRYHREREPDSEPEDQSNQSNPA